MARNCLYRPFKSETSDSFVNHFDGHFAYLKTLDFYFKHHVYLLTVSQTSAAGGSIFSAALSLGWS